MYGQDAYGIQPYGGAIDPLASVEAGALAFNLTLQDVGLKAARKLSAGPLSLVYTLQAVAFRTGFAMAAEPLHFFLTLNAVEFVTGQSFLPPASAGLNYWLFVRESVLVKARTGDTIYNGASTGTTLSSTDIGSILRIIGTDSGKWFILNKTGTWSLA